jgi:hypothetical protein
MCECLEALIPEEYGYDSFGPLLFQEHNYPGNVVLNIFGFFAQTWAASRPLMLRQRVRLRHIRGHHHGRRDVQVLG